MLLWLTQKKLRRICEEAYSRGVARGYQLGYQAGLVEKSNRGVILGDRLAQEIEALLKKRKGGGDEEAHTL